MAFDFGTFLSGLGGSLAGRAGTQAPPPAAPAGGLTAAAPAAPVEEEFKIPETVDDARKQYLTELGNLRRQQNALLASLESRAASGPQEMLRNISAAMLDPGRTGNFGEAFGRMQTGLSRQAAEDESRAAQIAKMRLDLTQSQLGQSKEMIDILRQNRIQELGKDLYKTTTSPGTPTGTLYGEEKTKGLPLRDDEGNLMPGVDMTPGKSIQRLNPDQLRKMMGVDPEGTMKYLQAQKAVQEITAPKQQKLSADDTVFEQNEDGSWKAVMSGQGKIGIEEKVAMQQLGIDPSKIGSLTVEQASALQNQIRANKSTIDTDIKEAFNVLGIPITRLEQLTVQERDSVKQYILDKKKAGAARSTVYVGAENSLANALGKAEAERIAALQTVATSAENAIKTAGDMRALLSGGNVITGPFSGVTLQANRFVGDPQKVQDTQLYLNQMATATLAAIKGSNLGTGAGFTDNDRKFLAEATSGNMLWNKVTLQRLADLNEAAARMQISRWNDVVKKIPPTILNQLPTMGPVEAPAFDMPKVPGKDVPILSGDPRLARMQKDSLPPGAPYAVYENGTLQGYRKKTENE